MCTQYIMSGLLNNYNGTVNPQANEFMPAQPREQEYRVVVNPIGLTAGTYLIHAEMGDPKNVGSIAQFALNLSTRDFWVRTAVTYPTTWSPWAQIGTGAGAGVITFNGRNGNVLPTNGDYSAVQITNVPNPPGHITAINVQSALNELDLKKVTLGNANVARDILVATNVGDNYSASGTTLPGHIGALDIGQTVSVTSTLTPPGFIATITGEGLNAAQGLLYVNETGPPPGATTLYGNVTIDARNTTPIGSATLLHSNLYSYLPSRASFGGPATGGPGAYHIQCNTAGTGPVFFVNGEGNVALIDSGNAAITGPVMQDSFGMLTLNVSRSEYKKDIQDVDDTSFIHKIAVKNFVYKNDKNNLQRIGAIIDECEQNIDNESIYVYQNNRDGTVDRAHKRDFCDRSLLFAAIAEVQKLRSDLDKLKSNLNNI